MPYVCCVPGCRGNYKDGPKVHAFKFPNNSELRSKWIAAIPREDFTPTKHSRVCELHFPQEKIISTSTAQDSRTGYIISINLKIPRLVADAVPVFPDVDTKIEVIDHEDLKNVKEENEFVYYENFEDFLTVLNCFEPPPNWNKIVTKEKVILCKLLECPGPSISYSVVIDNDLNVDTFLFGQKMNTNVINTPFLSYSIKEIKDLLIEMDKCDELDKIKNENNSYQALGGVTNIIDAITSSEKCRYSENSENSNVLPFISEQIKLLMLCQRKYVNYSNNTLIMASILHTLSPQAYNFLRRANMFILPHKKLIASLCSSVLSNSVFHENQVRLGYAQNIFRFLREKDKYVILTFEEIHFDQFLESKGENIVETIPLAESAIIFTIKSIKSTFEEVVYICPISEVDSKIMFSLLKTVITKLEEIGYKVFCVVSKKDALNGECMSHFVTPNQISIVYPHPVDNNRPLFYIYDSIHLLNRIRCDWLDCDPDQSLQYPDFETGTMKVAKLESLKELRKLANKLSNDLSVKALFPTGQERQNVALTKQIFNPCIVQALTDSGYRIQKSKETAEFIKIISTWWQILDFKNSPEQQNANNEFEQVITSDSENKDQKIVFLEKMLDWLNKWKQDRFPSRLTRETHMGLSHTNYGLLEATKYCFTELHMDSITLGKFQTDNLDHKFGRYRRLPGDKYHICVRQVYESEKTFAIQSPLILKSQNFGYIQVTKFCDIANKSINLCVQEELGQFNPCHLIEEHELNLKQNRPIIIYLTAYCCQMVIRRLRCDFCKETLVFPDEMVVEDNFNIKLNLGTDKLLLPKDFSVLLVCFSYIIFNKIVSEFEENFSFIDNKRQYLIEMVFRYVKENGYLEGVAECANHTTTGLTKMMLTLVLNILLKNYFLKTYDQLNKTVNHSAHSTVHS